MVFNIPPLTVYLFLVFDLIFFFRRGFILPSEKSPFRFFDVNASEFWFRAWWILLISHRCHFIEDIIKLCAQAMLPKPTNSKLCRVFLYGNNRKFILFNRICQNFFLSTKHVGINVINPSFIYLLEKFNRFVLEAIMYYVYGQLSEYCIINTVYRKCGFHLFIYGYYLIYCSFVFKFICCQLLNRQAMNTWIVWVV